MIIVTCRWTVGLLSEMPPEGKVGVSPVCVLGLNVNHGQEIQLRLRTDDLKVGLRNATCGFSLRLLGVMSLRF